MKRLFDITFSFLLMILLLPIFFFTPMFIVFETGFPFLFVQNRVGRGGKPFKMFKFRTMTVLKVSKEGSFDAGDSSRVTSVGKILRKTKIDELPQLFNVLFGNMSFVGPRPEVQKWVDIYPERWAFVHSVKPGITDNASIVYRNEEDILSASSDPNFTYKNEILPQKLELYEEYVRNNSFFGDIRIIFKTISSVLFK
ncbi:MAG: sugar transferase [Marinilabiliaceae bacterium]|nr:sugar transferase [Marinilabiliaceae bacterium]